METSKKLTYIFVIFYLVFITVSAFVNVKWQIDLSKFLDYVQPTVMTIVVFYFSKSGMENYTKIKTLGNSEETEQIQEDNIQN